MNRLKEIRFLKLQAEELHLENCRIIRKYNMRELCSIYNGIGPESFPGWLRKGITALHPSLAVCALIHDIEWHESDATEESFRDSNDRLVRNGIRVAKASFRWYDPRRYAVISQAKRFGLLCTLFGFHAWKTPCSCAVCRRKIRLDE